MFREPSKNEFDWNKAVEVNSEGTLQILNTYFDKSLSEKEFVKLWQSVPHKKKHRRPSAAKRQYRRLRERYGFFTGDLGHAEGEK